MIDCDFIPKAYHDQRLVKSALRQRTGCVVAMFGVMLIWLVAHQYQLSSASAMLKDVEQQKTQLGVVASKRAELEAERERLRAHQRLINQLADPADLTIVLSDLSRCMSNEVMLTEMSLTASFMTPYLVPAGTVPTVAATDKSGKAVEVMPIPPTPIETLRMTGITIDPANVFEFANHVEKSGLFDHVYAGIQEEKNWGGKHPHHFELTCELIPHERSSQ